MSRVFIKHKSDVRILQHLLAAFMAMGVAFSFYKLGIVIFVLLCLVGYIVLLNYGLKYLPVNEYSELVPPKRGMFTEGIVGIGFLIMILPIGLLSLYCYIFRTEFGQIRLNSNFPLIAAVIVFIMDIGFLFIIYSLTVKIKEKMLWNSSVLKLMIDFTRNTIKHTTDNSNVHVRTLVPYSVFIILNFLLIRIGLSGMVLAAVLDILVGMYLYHQNLDREKIIHVIENIQNGDIKAKVNVNEVHTDNISLAKAVNTIGEGIEKAVSTSIKDEKLKADLITNVSHDIKTPLTSIINYVDLIKREDIEDPKVKDYLKVLETKSHKLRQLTEDLVEISKISSGNIKITPTKINFVELINQTIGEFYEKFESKTLTPVYKTVSPEMMIMADPRHIWRVVENLVNNVCKYALPETRVYMDTVYRTNEEDGKKKVIFTIRNISADELKLESEDLSERFIRGDVSRATEGSGLGLSIAKDLTLAQGGSFNIRIDGDLFKAILEFDAVDKD